MFTYYRLPDRKTSFRIVADRQIFALRRKGHTVIERDLRFTKDSLDNPSRDQSSIALVHPLFYFVNWSGVSFDQVMTVLQQRHDLVYGFEVGDTDAISDRFVQWANHPAIKGIMLPSQFSMDAFRNSGVTASLKKIPHGVDMEASDNTFDYLQERPGPKILFFAGADDRRKGLNLLLKISPDFPDCTFVIKISQHGGQVRFRSNNKNLMPIRDWLSPAALASLYSNCDVFLALHRGGAFELHCLEALAYGLPVLAPNYGAVLDYLTEQNATLIEGHLERRFFRARNDHSGLEFRCDVRDAIDKLKTVLLELDEHKHRSRTEGEKIRQQYTWDRIADLIIDYTT